MSFQLFPSEMQSGKIPETGSANMTTILTRAKSVNKGGKGTHDQILSVSETELFSSSNQTISTCGRGYLNLIEFEGKAIVIVMASALVESTPVIETTKTTSITTTDGIEGGTIGSETLTTRNIRSMLATDGRGTGATTIRIRRVDRKDVPTRFADRETRSTRTIVISTVEGKLAIRCTKDSMPFPDGSRL